MRVRAFLIALLLLRTGTTHAQGAEHFVQLAGLRVATWAPDTGGGRRPVIIFSHGFLGCATQSRFLMEALARDGYIVFAPNHRDAGCTPGRELLTDNPLGLFLRPDEWTPATYRDRGDDIRRLVAALRADPRYRDRIDWDRFGLAGHSLGGYTVLALAGAWPDWTLPGVKAVLAMSPYSYPFIVHHTLGGLKAPVMYQGGEWDIGITPAVSQDGGAYDLSPPPKYYVEFAGATHFAWTDLPNPAHPAIMAYADAFFDHYLKGTNWPAAASGSGAGVIDWRFDPGQDLGAPANRNGHAGETRN